MTATHTGTASSLFRYLSAIFFSFQIETVSDEPSLFRLRRQTNHRNRGILSLLADYIKQVNTKYTNVNATLLTARYFGPVFKTFDNEQILTRRLLMSYIYGTPIPDVSRSYTTTYHSR